MPEREELDGYRVREKIGADPYAVFLRAEVPGGGGGCREVVVSVLHPRVAEQGPLVDAFVAASKRSLAPGDPRLLPVESLNVLGDLKYRASPLVRAWSWSTLLAHAARGEAPLTATACFWVAFQIATALATASDRRAGGYVHGAVSPHSVFVQADGAIKIAPPLLEPEASAGPRFVAPEVCAGQRPGPRSDVYSVGRLLWEALRLVLQPGSGDPAPLGESPPLVLRGLLSVISPDPDQRPKNPRELARRIGQIAPVYIGAGHLLRAVACLGMEPESIVGVPADADACATIHRGSPSGGAPVGPSIRVVGGGGSRALALGSGSSRWIVGRGRRADLVLEDSDASRQHFEVVREAGETFSVRDLGSKNGLFVNGRAVQRHSLTFGDELRAGNTRLRFAR